MRPRTREVRRACKASFREEVDDAPQPPRAGMPSHLDYSLYDTPGMCLSLPPGNVEEPVFSAGACTFPEGPTSPVFRCLGVPSSTPSHQRQWLPSVRATNSSLVYKLASPDRVVTLCYNVYSAPCLICVLAAYEWIRCIPGMTLFSTVMLPFHM